MIESNPYSYRVTKAVDKIKVPIFNTSQVKYLSALNFKDIYSVGANICLDKMKCVETVNKSKGCIAQEWRVKFEPGKNCKGCHFYKKFDSPVYGTQKRCARLERIEPDS